MGGSPLKHLKMFQNLCGTEALKNVVLVTTMWDLVGEEDGYNRENELTANYWKTMIDLGCHTSRFYNNTKSALDIVSQFQDARCTVLLQKKMVDLHLELADSETSSGRILFSFLDDFIKKFKEMLALNDAKLMLALNGAKLKQSANRIAVARSRCIANVQRRRYSISQSVLQGTITTLKLVQQIVGLAPIPGLQSLVGVVLNISEVVNVSFDTTYI